MGLEALESRVLLDGTPFGLSSFTPLGANPVIIAGPAGLNGAPLMDLNGDGLGDMIVEYGNGVGGSSTLAAVSALMVHADGSTTEYRIARYTVPSSAPLPVINQVVVGDFNGDGHPDLAVLHNDGASITTHKWIDVFMGQADGSFTQPAAPIALGSSVSTPAMTLFDQNGDGKTDIFLEDRTKFTAYLGNGDGTFAAPVVSDFQTLLIPLSLNKISSVSNAMFQQDLSGDGIPDLVVSGEVPTFARTGTQYALYVFKGQANGKYNLASPSFSETTDNLTLLTTGQLSSDNNPDIVAYSSTAGPDVASSVFVFRNTGNGTFTQSFHSATFTNNLPTIALGLNGPQQSLLTPDLTGDGVNDMILVEGGSGTNTNVTLHILKNNGNAGFTETQQIAFTSSPYDNSGLVEDVDGDGLPDLVVYRDVYPSVLATIYFNHGGGVFDATGLVPAPSSSVPPGKAPGLADFNSDGKLDLIYNSSSGVEVLLNTTGRAFAPGIDTVLTHGGPNLIRYQIIPPDPLLDYTGDGLPDLLSYNGDGFSVLASTGDGHFTLLQPSVALGSGSDAGYSAPPIVMDINHDGKRDLIWGPLPALDQFDENPHSLIVDINGATTPTDMAGADRFTARDLGALSGPIALDAFINTTWVDGNTLLHASDFYSFTLASPQIVRITAVAATGQVGLNLEDSSGTGITSSNALLPVIDATLDAGTYYVAVANDDTVDTHYRLDIAFPTALPSIGVRQGFATVINGQTSSIDFGSVLVATTDTHKDFTLYNGGLATLDLATMTLPAGFSLDGAAIPSTLAPGASATFSLVMDVGATGQFSGTVSIPSSDPLVSAFSFPVSGSVTGPVLTDLSGQFASSPSLPTGLIAGQSAPLSFTLSNAGPGADNGGYSVVFKLENGAPQLGKGDVAAGTASGAIALLAGATTDAITGAFTVPASLPAGTYYLAATLTDAGGLDANTADKTFFSGPITIGPPPTHIAFKTQPATTVAGHVIGPFVSVQLLDAANHVVTGDNSAVTIALTVNLNNATLNGTLTVAAIAGIATFNDLSLNKAGTYTLTATQGPLTSPKSSNFSVMADASIPTLVLAHQPLATTVGLALSPALVVDVQDQFGNVITTGTYASSTVVLTIASGPADGSFNGSNTLSVKAVKGLATFSKAVLSTAGTYTVNVTDGSFALTDPVLFTQVIMPGNTTVAAPHTSASYTFGQTINLSTSFKSTAGSSLPFTGTPTLVLNGGDSIPPTSFSPAGLVKFALVDVPADSYVCTLSYPGDVNHVATSSSFTLQVNQAATTTTLAANIAAPVFGQTLTLTAFVKASPSFHRSGSVNFLDNGQPLETQPLNGTTNSASLTFVVASTGSHSYQAVYLGDTDFKSSTSSVLKRTVGKDKTSVSVMPITSPQAINQTFDLHVQVSVLAPGASILAGDQVTVKDNGKAIATLTLDSSGSATLPAISYTASGAHIISVLFPGDADTLAATSSVLKLTIS
jgi:hypothetical protein